MGARPNNNEGALEIVTFFIETYALTGILEQPIGHEELYNTGRVVPNRRRCNSKEIGTVLHCR